VSRLTTTSRNRQKEKNEGGGNDSASNAQANGLHEQPWYRARAFDFKYREPVRSVVDSQQRMATG